MPYTGKETEKDRPVCPRCHKVMTFIMTDVETKEGGYRCGPCDQAGRGGVHMVGNIVVGRA